jgi:oxygen-independent coproporphyrinogen III oxidase
MAGIYIHIPFCKQKCSYCDFHFSTTFGNYRKRMLDAMIQEIQNRKDFLKGEALETIYFGGGTPSLLTADELQLFLNQIRNSYTVSEHAEISLEANPDDMTKEALLGWKAIGFNRLSVGLQSFRASDLKWMNRAHSAEEALNCIALAHEAGFRSLSVDLIYGLPDLDLATWKKHIDIVLDLPVQHISAYCLTIEEKTSLHKWVEQAKLVPSNDEEQSLQFETLIERLAEKGFEQYEISNFALSGHRSKHNSNYWKGISYLGIGPSAHSYDGSTRSWNIAHNQKYMQAIEKGEAYIELEVLTKENRFNETLLIGLRTVEGVDLTQLKAILPLSNDFLLKANSFVQEGWLIFSENDFYLTRSGRLRADYIASELFVVAS